MKLPRKIEKHLSSLPDEDLQNENYDSDLKKAHSGQNSVSDSDEDEDEKFDFVDEENEVIVEFHGYKMKVPLRTHSTKYIV